jgi:hypothetical protein
VGLHDGGDHVGAALAPAVRLAEHRVRLADAGRRTQVDAQFAAPPLVVGPIAHLTTSPRSAGSEFDTMVVVWAGSPPIATMVSISGIAPP